MKIAEDDLFQDAWEALEEEFGENDLEPESTQSDPELDRLVESLNVLARALASQFSDFHVINGKLTDIPPQINDTIH